MIFTKIEAARPGKWSNREKATIVLTILLVISWILPGSLSVFAPAAAITGWFNMITLLTPLIVIVVIMAIIRIDGRPLLDIPGGGKQNALDSCLFPCRNHDDSLGDGRTLHRHSRLVYDCSRSHGPRHESVCDGDIPGCRIGKS